jgi:hypothetical protein
LILRPMIRRPAAKASDPVLARTGNTPPVSGLAPLGP